MHLRHALALGTVAAALAGSPAASAATCPGTSTLGNELAVCSTFEPAPTPNTGYTVSGTVFPVCVVRTDDVCRQIMDEYFERGYPQLGATGVDVNGTTPPVPAFDPATGQLSAPAGTYGTLYVGGTERSINTPAYCVTVNVRCP